MTKKPTFSVIIPCLNEEKYLPKLLSSLVRQTYRNFEVIVADGQSDDRTVEIFHKVRSKLPSSELVVASKRNVAYQRNFGAMSANGEYLVFLDADTDVSVTFLEELHVAILKKKFLLATTWIAPDTNRSFDRFIILLGNLGQELAKGVGKPYVGGYNTIVKRNIFFKLKGFREDVKINEDHDFALRAHKLKISVFIMKEPVVTYSLRRHRSVGFFRLIPKLAYGQLYMHLIGPLKSDGFDYPMGGHVHARKRKRRYDLTKIDTYVKGIDTLEKKLIRLLTV